MPHAKILTKQALYTLSQLHSELAGKLSANQRETKRLRLAIFQVEAVMKLLSPDVNLRLIAPKRRNPSCSPCSGSGARHSGYGLRKPLRTRRRGKPERRWYRPSGSP